MSAARSLFDAPPDRRGTPAERAAAWLERNPAVWELFVRFAGEAKDAGLSRFSADAILHRIRWFVAVQTRGDDFKVNNDWAAYMARKLMAERPEFAGFFELRRSRQDRAG
jgi:hypothetical protein